VGRRGQGRGHGEPGVMRGWQGTARDLGMWRGRSATSGTWGEGWDSAGDKAETWGQGWDTAQVTWGQG